jgi:F-type H+-transporting ATPase subunit b
MRRFRLLLAAAAAVLVILGLAATPAHAAGESEEGCIIEAVHTAEEAVGEGAEIEGEALEALEADVKACKQAPNQLLPEKNEIIFGGLAFFVVFAFIWKMGLPAIKGGMNARTERIQGDLDAAEAQRTEASAILAEYQTQLADARNESARIIEEARQAADEVKQSLTAKAQADIAELRGRATADIEAAKVQAIADLRGEVASLAIGAAEQVVERSLDRDTQVALVDAYIDQVGADR